VVLYVEIEREREREKYWICGWQKVRIGAFEGIDGVEEGAWWLGLLGPSGVGRFGDVM